MLYRIFKLHDYGRIKAAAALAVTVALCFVVPSQAQSADAVDTYGESSTAPPPPPPVESASNTAALSPDGSTLAVADRSRDGIALWDIRSGKKVRVLKGCKCETYRLVFAPNGLTVASAGFECSKGNRMHLWDVQTGVMRTMFTGGMKGHLQVGYMQDGRVGVSEPDLPVRYWSAVTGKPARTGPTGSVVFTPDGRVFPRTIIIDSILADPYHPVGFFTFSPDGRALVTAAYVQPDRVTRSEVSVWNAQTGNLLHRMPIHPYVLSLSATDANHILVGGKDTAILWSPFTDAMNPLLKPHWPLGLEGTGVNVNWVQFSRQGLVAAFSASSLPGVAPPAGKWHGQISIWSTKTGTKIRTVQP